MALSDEQISLMAFNDDPGDWNNLAFRDCWVNGYKTGARAIEAEVRKQDDALTPEQISASDAWFHARINMLDTLDRRNVFRAGFDRGWNAALAAQGGSK